MNKRKLFLTLLIVLSVLTMSVSSVSAEEEEDDDEFGNAKSNSKDGGIRFTDFLDKRAAKEQMDSGAMSTPIEHASGWATLGLYLILALYFGKMFLLYFSGDPEKRALGIVGFIVGVVGIIAFMVAGTTAFDAITWDYS